MSSDYIKARLVARSIEDAERTRLQNEADAKLGRMVRKLAESYKQDVALCFDNGWGWCIEIDKESNDLEYFDQPEHALAAAGIKDD